MSGLSDRSQFYNRLLLLVTVVVLVGFPAYLAMFGTAVWQSPQYWQAYLTDPAYLWQTYRYLITDYWWVYRGQLELDMQLKLIGPTIAAVFVAVMKLFVFRAPLTDFRPFKTKESIHGDAHWASPAEIKKAGLLSKEGVMLGQYKKGKYFIADGFQHILLFAPTGSGKGVGFAIPNLLFWKQSCCVHDIKLENWELASGWRASQGQDVYVWNPADPNGITHCYNPLDWISSKPGQMVDDVQKISNLILPEQEFWQNEARSLLVGVMLYLCAVPEKVTSFGEVVRTMRSDDVTYNLAVVLDTIGKKIHPVAYMNIAAFLQKADKERSGVVSTLNSGLELWANPLIDTATASSDFNVAEWKKKKITVYCGVTPDNLQRLQPLLQVFYQQCTDILTRHMPKPDEPYGVLFLLDEFPTLGKMPQFEAGIAYFRGYRVRLFLIVQDTQQLKGIYEEAGMNSFLSNATYRITFAANNVETANLISQLIGNKTVTQESHNRPKFLDLNPASRTMHVSETQRALLLPQEVIQLPRDEQIILIESQPPIRCMKIFYYKDSFFTKRLMKPTPVPEQEPYDPRKAQGGTAEPPPDDAGAGRGHSAKAGGNKRGGGKPPSAGKPPAPPPPPPPPSPDAGKPASASPHAGGTKAIEQKPNPFDLPPLPPKKPPAPKAPAGGAANPFDLPPLPPKKPATPKEAPVAASANPFDIPPLPPKKAAAPKAPAGNANPFDLPPLPAKKSAETAAAKPAANPFDLPPLPARKSASATPTAVEEKSVSVDLPPPAAAQETAKPAAKSPFDLPPLPAKKPVQTAAAQPAGGGNPFDLPPLPVKKDAGVKPAMPAASAGVKTDFDSMPPAGQPAVSPPPTAAQPTPERFGTPIPKPKAPPAVPPASNGVKPVELAAAVASKAPAAEPAKPAAAAKKSSVFMPAMPPTPSQRQEDQPKKEEY